MDLIDRGSVLPLPGARTGFLKCAEMLARSDLVREAVSAADLTWERIAPDPRPWRRLVRWIWHRLTAVPGAISIARPMAARRDLDGKPIFLDEHDAPFVLLPGGHLVYVRVFRAVLSGSAVLLTEPDPNPVRCRLAPQDRARLALLHTLEGWKPIGA
ncbi:MAG: hypothetical protein AAFR17_02865 [Pseudomonadota bacterium]